MITMRLMSEANFKIIFRGSAVDDGEIGKVRRVAEVYDSKRGNDRKSYWNRTVDTLGDQLDALGYDEAAINRELQTFTQAVKAELDRMRGTPPTSRNPDGAA